MYDIYGNEQPVYSKNDVVSYMNLFKESPRYFKPDQIKTLKKYADYYQLPYNEEQFDFSFSILDSIRQLGEGFVSGFTTIEIGKPSANVYENIFRSIGQAAGFVGYIPAQPVSWAAKGIELGAKAVGISAKVLQPVAKLANINAARALTRSVTSVPMTVANLATKKAGAWATGAAAKAAAIGSGNALGSVTNFLTSSSSKHILHGAFRMGVSSSMSNWQHGVDQMWKSFWRGAAVGGFSYGLAEGFQVGKWGVGKPIEPWKFSNGRPVWKLLEPAQKSDMVIRMAANSLYDGLPETLRGATAPEQVYSYVMGAFFGFDDPDSRTMAVNRFMGKYTQEVNTIRPTGVSQDPSKNTTTKPLFDALDKPTQDLVVQSAKLNYAYNVKNNVLAGIVNALGGEKFTEESFAKHSADFEKQLFDVAKQQQALDEHPIDRPEGVTAFEEAKARIDDKAVDLYRGLFNQVYRGTVDNNETGDLQFTRDSKNGFIDFYDKFLLDDGVDYDATNAKQADELVRLQTEFFKSFPKDIKIPQETDYVEDFINNLKGAYGKQILDDTGSIKPGIEAKLREISQPLLHSKEKILYGIRLGSYANQDQTIYKVEGGINEAGDRAVQMYPETAEEQIYEFAYLRKYGVKPEGSALATLNHGIKDINGRLVTVDSLSRFDLKDWQRKLVYKQFLENNFYYFSGKKDKAIEQYIRFHPETDTVNINEAYSHILKNDANMDNMVANSAKEFGVSRQEIKKWIVSNAYYELEKNGFDADITQVAKIMNGNSNLIKDASAWTKRISIWDSTGYPVINYIFNKKMGRDAKAPLRAAILETMINEGNTKDINASANTFKEQNDGRDVVSKKVFDAIMETVGGAKDGNTGKFFIYDTSDGLGALLNKSSTEVAEPGSAKARAMEELGVDMILTTTTAKQYGMRDTGKWMFDKDGNYSFSKEPEKFNIMPESIKVLTGKKVDAHLNNRVQLKKQMVTNFLPPMFKHVDGQFSDDEINQAYGVLNDMYDTLTNNAKLGDSVYNEKLEVYLKTGDEKLLKELSTHIDDIGLEELLSTLKNPQASPFTKKFLDHVIRNRESNDELNLLESGDTDEIIHSILQENGKFQTAIDRFIKLSGDSLNAYLFKWTNGGKIQDALNSYVTNRLLRPRLNNSSEAVIDIFDHEAQATYAKDMLNDDTIFYLGKRKGAQEIRSKVLSKALGYKNGKLTLWEIWENRDKFNKNPEWKAAMEDIFDAAVVRVPADSMSGIQRLRFAGFTNKSNYGIMLHGRTMQLLGGADSDIDAAYIFFGGDGGFKKSWKEMYESQKYEHAYWEGSEATTATKTDIRLSGESIKDIQDVFSKNRAIQNIGNKDEYARYINNKFPNSKITDVLYHGSKSNVEKFDNTKSNINIDNPLFNEKNIEDAIKRNELNKDSAYYFTNDSDVASSYFNDEWGGLKGRGVVNKVLLNVKNPKIIEASGSDWSHIPQPFYKKVFISPKDTFEIRKVDGKFELGYEYGEVGMEEMEYNVIRFNSLAEATNAKINGFETKFAGTTFGSTRNIEKQYKNSEYDGVIIKDVVDVASGDPIRSDIYIIYNPKQIHILGSKKDIAEFYKQSKSGEAKTTTKSIRKPKLKGGFENVGKGTPEGDGKDKAMRDVANGFIGEISGNFRKAIKTARGSNRQEYWKLDKRNRVGLSSTETSLLKIANKYSNGEFQKASASNFVYGGNPASIKDSDKVIMLARNGKLKNTPLDKITKSSIKWLSEKGAKFVVGDMPGVDSKFIDYLNEIGADYTIYHTGTKPLIDISSQPIGKPQGVNKPTVRVLNGVGAVNTATAKGEGINTLRKAGYKHFGNPFSHLPADKTRGAIQVKSIDEAVWAYSSWLEGTAYTDVKQDQRKWILDQIDSGKLDGKDLLYFKGGYRSHADALADFVADRRGDQPVTGKGRLLLSPEDRDGTYKEMLVKGSEKPVDGQLTMSSMNSHLDPSMRLNASKSTYNNRQLLGSAVKNRSIIGATYAEAVKKGLPYESYYTDKDGVRYKLVQTVKRDAKSLDDFRGLTLEAIRLTSDPTEVGELISADDMFSKTVDTVFDSRLYRMDGERAFEISRDATKDYVKILRNGVTKPLYDADSALYGKDYINHRSFNEYEKRLMLDQSKQLVGEDPVTYMGKLSKSLDGLNWGFNYLDYINAGAYDRLYAKLYEDYNGKKQDGSDRSPINKLIEGRVKRDKDYKSGLRLSPSNLVKAVLNNQLNNSDAVWYMINNPKDSEKLAKFLNDAKDDLRSIKVSSDINDWIKMSKKDRASTLAKINSTANDYVSNDIHTIASIYNMNSMMDEFKISPERANQLLNKIETDIKSFYVMKRKDNEPYRLSDGREVSMTEYLDNEVFNYKKGLSARESALFDQIMLSPFGIRENKNNPGIKLPILRMPLDLQSISNYGISKSLQKANGIYNELTQLSGVGETSKASESVIKEFVQVGIDNNPEFKEMGSGAMYDVVLATGDGKTVKVNGQEYLKDYEEMVNITKNTSPEVPRADVEAERADLITTLKSIPAMNNQMLPGFYRGIMGGKNIVYMNYQDMKTFNAIIKDIVGQSKIALDKNFTNQFPEDRATKLIKYFPYFRVSKTPYLDKEGNVKQAGYSLELMHPIHAMQSGMHANMIRPGKLTANLVNYKAGMEKAYYDGTGEDADKLMNAARGIWEWGLGKELDPVKQKGYKEYYIESLKLQDELKHKKYTITLGNEETRQVTGQDVIDFYAKESLPKSADIAMKLINGVEGALNRYEIKRYLKKGNNVIAADNLWFNGKNHENYMKTLNQGYVPYGEPLKHQNGDVVYNYVKFLDEINAAEADLNLLPNIDVGIDGARKIMASQHKSVFHNDPKIKLLNTISIEDTGYLKNFFPHLWDVEGTIKNLDARLREVDKDPTLSAEAKSIAILKILAPPGNVQKDIMHDDLDESLSKVLGAPDGKPLARGHIAWMEGNTKAGHMESREFHKPGWRKDHYVWNDYYASLSHKLFNIYSQMNNHMQVYRFYNDYKDKYPANIIGSHFNMYKQYAQGAMGFGNKISDELRNDPDMAIKGTLYDRLSDDSVAGLITKVGRKLGLLQPKIEGKITSEVIDKLRQDLKKYEFTEKELRYLSNLEAQYQMATLLASPKTFINNIYGGQMNNIISAGFKNLRDARNIKYLQKINPEWTSMAVVQKWIEDRGIIDEFIIHQMGINPMLSKGNFGGFMSEAIDKLRKDPAMDDKSMLSIARKYHIKESVLDKAAWFMRKSERILRRDSFMTHYIQAYKRWGEQLSYNNPWLIQQAIDGVKATQFLYSAPFKPMFATSAAGSTLTRFQMWAWRNIELKSDIINDALNYGIRQGTPQFDRFKRMALLDVLSIGLANAFMYSIFDSALPAPWNWMQDFADLIFGDEKERDKAFFGAYPGVLKPLQMFTPPSLRLLPPTITAMVNNDFSEISEYHIWAMFPFGRIGRDLMGKGNVFENPYQIVEKTTGFPYRGLSNYIVQKRKEEPFVGF